MAASFVYDGLGRRMSKNINGTPTQYLYDRLNPVQEIQGGSPSANLLTGLRLDEYFTRTDSSNNMSTLLTDGVSTIGLMGPAQTIATSYSYQPFGATTIGGASNGNSYQFTGRENDGTGLYYYRARYYSPTFQRFIGQDPIGFAGGDPNLYRYVGGNPIGFVDGRGLQQASPLVPIYRAVKDPELNQILETGTFQPGPFGEEAKSFSTEPRRCRLLRKASICSVACRRPVHHCAEFHSAGSDHSGGHTNQWHR